MQRRCEICKYAEWDYCEGFGGFWAICGCKLVGCNCTDLIDGDEWDDDWGDTKDCPLWEELL